LNGIANTPKGPIEYSFVGAGPVVVVLNGGHCSRRTRLSHEKLAEYSFSVLTPSRPGYDNTPSSVGRTAQAAAQALAALLDSLNIYTVDLIGISAAGPTALAFAAQYPGRLRKLILESAVTTPWSEKTKRQSRVVFGKLEKLTWAFVRLVLHLAPKTMIRTMMKQLTALEIGQVMQRMSKEDLQFVYNMIESSQSGKGFICDIEHVVAGLSDIKAPVLAMYSPNDGAVSPSNSKRLGDEVPSCELFEVPSDSHLLWIGASAATVWEKRLSFLKSG
jgi:pimeloyl-ACP methyl ester carboxylesterase